MCGIAGKLRLHTDRPVTLESVSRMCQVLRHRGPDDEGFYLEGRVGLGMRRLSIIDLTTGRQPIQNEDGSVWTVFNGEIYNFAAQRSLLEAKGHVFRTNTDTEVIVHLYEEFGPSFVTHLTGMFALAVWDRRRRQLLLARDRLGIKPLYYAVTADTLLFGSELKSVLEGGASRDVDVQALHDYLSLSYVPGPQTIFRGIRKLPPGHLLLASAREVSLRRYWTIEYPATLAERTEESYVLELRDLLRTVVQEHLISDVPLGVFLSGGVDSSTLVALMREVSGQRIRTFSIGFDEKSYSELDNARVIARRFDTEHHEAVVAPDAVDLLPALIRYFDEPFADSSAIPVYCVARLAREHVTVALSGEGGDEVFAGYETYAAYRLAEVYKRLPGGLSRTVIPRILRRLPVSHRKISFDYKAKRFVNGALLPPAEAHYAWKVVFSEDAKRALYADGAVESHSPFRLYRDAYERCSAGEILTKLQHIDQTVYLPDDILVKADRMTMANSLEARVPFVDHRIVEFAASLPARLKLNGLRKKYLLKRCMADVLPADTLHGRKRGFNVPIPAWLGRELRDLVHDVLSPKRTREAGFFDADAVSALIRDHEAKRLDYSRNIWALLIFTLWCDEYLGPLRRAETQAFAGVGA